MVVSWQAPSVPGWILGGGRLAVGLQVTDTPSTDPSLLTPGLSQTCGVLSHCYFI